MSVWTKNASLENLSENFENFQKFLKKSIQQMRYFSLFSIKILKPCLTFSRLWAKNTNFLGIFSEKSAFWNKVIFTNNFFSISEVWECSPCPHCRLIWICLLNWKEIIYRILMFWGAHLAVNKDVTEGFEKYKLK